MAVRELTPAVDTVERTGLKASHHAHKAAKAAAHKAHKAGLKASIKAKIAAHKAQKGNLDFNILSELNFCYLENLFLKNSYRLRANYIFFTILNSNLKFTFKNEIQI